MLNQKIVTPKALTIFNFKDALDAGLSRRAISAKVKAGEFIKLSHGLYYNLNSDLPSEHIDYMVAHHKFGNTCIISGLTSLFYHRLIDQAPQQIWVMVPQEVRTNNKKYRLIRVKTINNVGVEPNLDFRISDINRTLVEAFHYATKIGIRTAFSATIRAVKEKQTSLGEIMSTARELGLQNSIEKHWESIVGMLEV